MNNKATYIIIGIILIGAAFYGGMKYGQSKPDLSKINFQNLTPEEMQQLRGSFRGGGRSGQNTGGGAVNGQILNSDNKSITIKLRNGGSQIVFFSNSTKVFKATSASTIDISVGEQVTVTGTANQDGSYTAQTIQIRPATNQLGQ